MAPGGWEEPIQIFVYKCDGFWQKSPELRLAMERVLKTFWKPHKSKEHNFLHRNYTPTFFSQLQKKYFFDRSKKTFFWSRVFLVYSFDVKNCVLSIYEVSRSFWALFGVVLYDCVLGVWYFHESAWFFPFWAQKVAPLLGPWPPGQKWTVLRAPEELGGHPHH